MAIGRRPEGTPTWTIRSVALRTRDGPERLDQAYRRLLAPTPPDERPADLDGPSVTPAPDRTPR
ncbi:MAG TPA: hypothetical protein VN702_19715 [Acetobacteraceae bacterium]|jgi:hypothetical protein|nr:hypothetical protein [Acetobacteraceae bacterium]